MLTPSTEPTVISILVVPIVSWLVFVEPLVALDPSIDVGTADYSQNLDLLDSNLQKTGELVNLKYDEVEFLNQPLASRVENVNPFNMLSWTGRVTLSPQSDKNVLMGPLSSKECIYLKLWWASLFSYISPQSTL